MTAQSKHQPNRGFALKLIEDQHSELTERLALIEKPIPQPGPGQVLVKVLASPVNPSDLVYLQGNYGVEQTANAFAGFEGCGVVVNANAGFYGHYLQGKRVAMAAQAGFDGFWGNYALTRATNCLPLRQDISDEQGATLIVNPLTSVCLVERAMALSSKAVILNAAASQVGKGVIRYAKLAGVKVIATVRSPANVEVLQKLGADQVLLTTDPDYAQTLKQLAKQMQATVLLDAVAAQDTALVLHQMPEGSTAIIYGRLTETHARFGGEFGVADLIFRNCRIEGFWLATFMRHAKPWQIIGLSRKVQKLFAEGIFTTDIYGVFSFDNFLPALAHYAENKSEGKVILKP
jgi:NADPH:quinone reductase-like Zn-dependent oxidoreductase